MDALFSAFARSVAEGAGMAVAAAFAWGVASVLLSPCHLASIPLIVGFLGDRGPMPWARALGVSLAFAAGVLATITLLGVLTSWAGRIAGDVGAWGNWAVAAVFFAVGLHLLEVIQIPLPEAGRPGMKRTGAGAAFALGLVYGVALGPCTFAYMAPVLGAAFRFPARGLALTAAYGAGHCAVIALAGVSLPLVERVLHWNERSRGLALTKKACGVLVLAAGLWLVYSAP